MQLLRHAAVLLAVATAFQAEALTLRAIVLFATSILT